MMAICAWEGCEHPTHKKSKYCKTHKAAARQAWISRVRKEPIAAPADFSAAKTQEQRYLEIWLRCVKAAEVSAKKCRPTPMLVVQHANVLDDRSKAVKTWVAEGGSCGMAWVELSLRHPFSKWLVKTGRAKKHTNDPGAYVRRIIPSTHSPLEQSYERNLAIARGFIEQLVKELPTMRKHVHIWHRED